MQVVCNMYSPLACIFVLGYILESVVTVDGWGQEQFCCRGSRRELVKWARGRKKGRKLPRSAPWTHRLPFKHPITNQDEGMENLIYRAVCAKLTPALPANPLPVPIWKTPTSIMELSYWSRPLLLELYGTRKSDSAPAGIKSTVHTDSKTCKAFEVGLLCIWCRYWYRLFPQYNFSF